MLEHAARSQGARGRVVTVLAAVAVACLLGLATQAHAATISLPSKVGTGAAGLNCFSKPRSVGGSAADGTPRCVLSSHRGAASLLLVSLRP